MSLRMALMQNFGSIQLGWHITTGSTLRCCANLWKWQKRTLSELKEHGMSSSLIKAVNVRFDENSMTIALSDGRALGVPLAWFPRLLHASQAQRMQYRISTRGLHWEALDEDISLAGLLAGYGDMTRRPAQEHKSARAHSKTPDNAQLTRKSERGRRCLPQ